MTVTPARVRKVEDVDRDIDQARRERARTLIQIDQYLASIAALRSKYARAGRRIDTYLDERAEMAAATPFPRPPAVTHPPTPEVSP